MTKQLTRSAVRIYGSLTALGNGSGNILESLLPFFDPILRQWNGKKFDPDGIAAAVRETYKWNFNSDLAEAFIPYLERQGWVIADIPDAQGATTYTIQMAESESPNDSVQTIEAELRHIATQFKEFSEALSPLTTIPRDVEEFEDILVEWLLYVEAFSEKNIDFKTSLKQDASGKLRQIVEVPNSTSLRDEEKFLCARFVKHSIEEDEGSAEVLARIAAIGLLTEVVQDFVKPVSAVEKSDLIVYLDAPVAMELLGVSGKSARNNTAPVIEELIRIGASVRIFGQSIDEIKNSLRAVLDNPRPTGPTAQALMRREVLREYVTEIALNPAQFLEEIGVKVAYRTLDQTPSEHPYFTIENWRELYAKLNYSENPHAREHDTDITTFVLRQRRGRTSRDVFKSHVVALTRNGLLAQIVRRACTEMLGLPSDAVPPVVHRRVLATAMWLRTGLGAADLNIPKRMLLASCEHVLAIRPGVVEAVKRFTDALGDEEKTRQLDLLISRERSAQALMDKTLGVSNVVTEENLHLLWQEMLHPYLEDERQKSREAVDSAKAEAKKRLERANVQIETIRKEKETQSEILQQNLFDDKRVIEALCAEVECSLGRTRKFRIVAALGIALVFCIPLILETTPLLRLLSTVGGLITGYLTLTGGKLFGTAIKENQAIARLHTLAAKRSLLQKLDQFYIGWENSAFSIAPRGEVSSAEQAPDDLLGKADPIK